MDAKFVCDFFLSNWQIRHLKGSIHWLYMGWGQGSMSCPHYPNITCESILFKHRRRQSEHHGNQSRQNDIPSSCITLRTWIITDWSLQSYFNCETVTISTITALSRKAPFVSFLKLHSLFYGRRLWCMALVRGCIYNMQWSLLFYSEKGN